MSAERFLQALGEIDDKYIEEARYIKMKKRFNFKPIIAAAACAVFALAAIPVATHFANTPTVQGTQGPQSNKLGASGEFTVYEYGVHAGYIIGTHKVEMKLNSTRDIYSDEAKKGTMGTVVLNGMEWTAPYENSRTATDYNVPYDRYTGIANGREVTFGINSVTGKCEYFRFNHSENTSGEKLTRDELYEIAYANFLSGGYVDDTENFQLVREGNHGTGGYWFLFARFVDGVQTSESVRIGLRNNGEQYWYVGNHIGEMKDVDVSGIDIEKFYAAVEVKLKKIYGDAYIDFDRNGAVLTKLTNGSYIFDYGVDTNVKDDNGAVVKDRCFFTIIID